MEKEPEAVDVEAVEETAIVPLVEELSSLPANMSPDGLRKALAIEQEMRDIWDTWIKDNLREGTDYGQIINKKTGRPIGKPSLWKPGAERVCVLMRLRPTFDPDDETWKMLPKEERDGGGLFAYRCRLVNMRGEIVAEGRGTASVNEKSTDRYEGWSSNMAIKMAQKRAQVDAVLRVAGLSDRFTQDMEDFPGNRAGPKKQTRPARVDVDAGGDVEGKPEARMTDTSCELCGKKLTEKQAGFSEQKFHRPLCYTCQKKGGAASPAAAPADVTKDTKLHMQIRRECMSLARQIEEELGPEAAATVRKEIVMFCPSGTAGKIADVRSAKLYDLKAVLKSYLGG